jgi:hypothetical protein
LDVTTRLSKTDLVIFKHFAQSDTTVIVAERGSLVRRAISPKWAFFSSLAISLGIS